MAYRALIFLFKSIEKPLKVCLFYIKVYFFYIKVCFFYIKVYFFYKIQPVDL